MFPRHYMGVYPAVFSVTLGYLIDSVSSICVAKKCQTYFKHFNTYQISKNKPNSSHQTKVYLFTCAILCPWHNPDFRDSSKSWPLKNQGAAVVSAKCFPSGWGNMILYGKNKHGSPRKKLHIMIYISIYNILFGYMWMGNNGFSISK